LSARWLSPLTISRTVFQAKTSEGMTEEKHRYLVCDTTTLKSTLPNNDAKLSEFTVNVPEAAAADILAFCFDTHGQLWPVAATDTLNELADSPQRQFVSARQRQIPGKFLDQQTTSRNVPHPAIAAYAM
jgi:hypothetical protein